MSEFSFEGLFKPHLIYSTSINESVTPPTLDDIYAAYEQMMAIPGPARRQRQWEKLDRFISKGLEALEQRYARPVFRVFCKSTPFIKSLGAMPSFIIIDDPHGDEQAALSEQQLDAAAKHMAEKQLPPGAIIIEGEARVKDGPGAADELLRQIEKKVSEERKPGQLP